jgi:hypothetical protein
MPIGKMVSLFILPLGNPEICQNPPTCGQDDLVLLMITLIFSKKLGVYKIMTNTEHKQKDLLKDGLFKMNYVEPIIVIIKAGEMITYNILAAID